MAGTIPLSLTQQFDEFGEPLSGGLLYIIQAGTVATPQQPYQDVDLTITHPNPIELDAAGRVPQFFLDDGEIKVRLTNSEGVTQLARDNILVIGPSGGGGGGGGAVDPTTIFQTGMLAIFYGTGTVSGYVRSNGRTIGSASSGATERANADCQPLFEYLWNADTNLSVSGGRGVSAAADWSANKQISLPDWRGRTIAGLDDMGSSAAGRLTATYWGGSGIVLGQTGGSESNTLVAANHAAHQHDVYVKETAHSHTVGNGTNILSNNVAGNLWPGGTGGGTVNLSTNTATASVTVGSVNGTANDNKVASQGSGTPHANMQPTMLATIYLKL
jgi:microcystin-dependent protein